MKYLTKHLTEAAYEAAASSLAKPHVALTADDNKVHYMPTTPPTPSHEYVDLGLPSGTKWATMNVGANSVTDIGNYYNYGKGTNTCNELDEPYEGMENPLASSADTASVAWGGSWHMPTTTQCQELLANTSFEYTTINEVSGAKFTAEDGSGNYIFIPFGEEGTSTLDYLTSTPLYANSCNVLSLYSDGENYIGEMPRYTCFPIRPVMDA